MLQNENLEVLVVTTVDATHDFYIVPAVKAGIKVLTEKPMTTWVMDRVPDQHVILETLINAREFSELSKRVMDLCKVDEAQHGC